MIDEARTLEIFGYNVKDLAPQSHKEIVAICEECGNVRVIPLQRYVLQKYPELCQTCIYNNPERGKNISTANIGRHYPTDETRAKMSVSQTGRKATPETLERMRIAHTGIMHTQEAKDKISAARIGRFCQSGENNHNWKGGVTPWRKLLHKSSAYKNWRAAVFERDNYTCQMCNTRGGYLQAHHIEPVRDNKNTLLIFDVNNGITLCKKCHYKTVNREYDFIEQFKNIVENINKTS